MKMLLNAVGSRVGSSSGKEPWVTDEDGIIKDEDSGSGIMEDENEPSTFKSVTSHPQNTKIKKRL